MTIESSATSATSPAWRSSRLVLGLFIASGFAGLIYQSIWSHYLGLLLGHAAYAQTLVLAIFMGGMAIGAWLSSRSSHRWVRLFAVYALIEAVIGALGVVFHGSFAGYSAWMQQSLLPLLGDGAAATAAQWLGASILIAPQSILLGMTFPIMSGAYLRAAPGNDTRVLGGLYFANSIGAAAGALASTFVLMPAVGLPGTVLTAGVINFAVAAVAWFGLAKRPAAPPSPAPSPTAADGRIDPRWFYAASAITGATSFVYEISWVRMLNQTLGASVHSFELMLASFILGLALGGAWVARRRGRIENPLELGAYAQIAMGAAALLSVVAFAHSFDAMGWLIGALGRSGSSYTLFLLGSGVLAAAVMLPAAFFAGMTLPLFTAVLLRGAGNESAIGRMYAWNTAGAIVGVFVAVHALIPYLGLRYALVVAALADIVLGFALLRRWTPEFRWRALGGAVAASSFALLAAFAWGAPSPETLASGVFRTGSATLSHSRVESLRDGKTASITVAVQHDGNYRSIATNGKPDATLAARLELPPAVDEITMIMAAALPLARHPAPKQVAVIGWGSGLTTHTLLGSPAVERVDNIEIERAMHDSARLFGDRVARAYDDPRSKLVVDDARTYLAAHGTLYDAIVSEPSNPWVSGVANLFTHEWYGMIQSHLEPDGMLVQWLHTYEIDDTLVATMIAALLERFRFVEAYVANSADLLFVASMQPIGPVDWTRIAGTPVEPELARVGLAGPAGFDVRRIGDQHVLRTFVRQLGVRPHSDYFPVVSLGAPRTRFMGAASYGLQDLVSLGMPIRELMSDRHDAAAPEPAATPYEVGFAARNTIAQWVQESLLAAEPSTPLFERNQNLAAATGLLASMSQRRVERESMVVWSAMVATVAEATMGALPADRSDAIWRGRSWLAGNQLPEAAALLDVYAAAAARDARSMVRAAEAALEFRDAFAPAARTQVAILGVLGHLASDDADAAARAMDSWRDDLERERRYRGIVSWLATEVRSRRAAPIR